MKINKLLLLSLPLLMLSACGGTSSSFNPSIPEYDDDVSVDTSSISLSLSSLSIKTNETFKLVASVKNYKGSVIWESNDNQIASVDNEGLVSGIKEGQTTITASIPNHVATCIVNVETFNDIPFISLGYQSITLYTNDSNNNSQTIYPKVYFEGNDITEQCEISCSLGDGQASDVANFAINNKTVKFTSNKIGSAEFVIAAKYKDYLVSSVLTVSCEKKLNSISLDDKTLDLDFVVNNDQLVYLDQYEIPLTSAEQQHFSGDVTYLQISINNKVYTTGASYDNTKKALIISKDIFDGIKYGNYDIKLMSSDDVVSTNISFISDIIDSDDELINWHLVANKIAGGSEGVFDGHFKLAKSFKMSTTIEGTTLFAKYVLAINRPTSLSNETWRSNTAGFKGIFDGDGYAIIDLNNGKKQADGFIFNLNKTGVLKNIAFDDYHITNPTNAYNGCIVAYGEGKLENVYVESYLQKQSAQNNDFSGFFNYNSSWLCSLREAPTYKNVVMDFTPIETTATATVELGGFAGGACMYKSGVGPGEFAKTEDVFAITKNSTVKSHLFFKNPDKREYATAEDLPGVKVIDTKDGITDQEWISNWNSIWKIEDPKIN